VTLHAGTRLSSYEIVRPIGAGGMGEVYRARDTKLSRDVAIKVLPPALASDTERLARFEKEARTASALNHPNIVTIYEIGQTDGFSFIAMELVEGRTLRELVGAGPVPLKKLLSVAAQAADGIAKAHAAGIVHRDLKPENLMVTRDGFVKILDFGLAKLVRSGFESSRGTDTPTVTRGTEAGTVLGTVGYMSPEQASGQPADFRSDQFSLGSILYEMITGKRAFERPSDAQVLSAIIESEPEPLVTAAPRMPTNLAWIVERCLAKDPEDRYGSTKDLARDLAMLRDQSSGVSTSDVLPPERRRLRVSRAGLAAAVLAVAGLAVLTFLAGQRVQARHDREAPPPKRTTLTFRRGYLTGARFAPDGQTIVYSACWDGKRSEIFTTRVGSNDSRALGIENAAILAVSATGEMAISIDCDSRGIPCMGTLARVPLAGGAPREILSAVISADWSPDGKDLAVAVWGAIQYPIGKKLYQAESSGFVSSLRVSPDGNLVAFLDHPGRDSERGILSVVDRAGRKRVLTNEWAKAGPLLWSPAGDEVFFTRWGGHERRGARLSGGTRSASWVPGLDDVSRDGLFLDTGMLSENYRGVILARVPDEPAERNLSWLGRSVAVELSRDGRRLLLFEEGRNPDRQEDVFTTFLRGTDGSDAMRVGDGRALALSPDQQWALVVRANPETHLVLLPTREGEPRRLPGVALLYRRATFFPDGRRMLYNADDKQGTTHTYIQDIEGGPPRQIGKEGMYGTLVSPDGRTVTLMTHEGVYFYSADGEENPRPVRGALGNDVPIQWSSDGTTIYTWAFGEEPLTLYRLDLATGRRQRFKQLAPPDMTGFLRYGSRLMGPGVTVTPDGRYYAYTYFTDQSRLVLAEAEPDWWK
jgi:hypothetical protein